MEVMEVMVRCKGEALASRCMFEPVPSEKLGPVYRYACLFASPLPPSPPPRVPLRGSRRWERPRHCLTRAGSGTISGDGKQQGGYEEAEGRRGNFW